MGNTERKNVLMTTMSVLKDRVKMSYYYFFDTENATSLYCDGISSLEPGTKYFLSKYRIDEIIVVGSKETIKDGDQRDIANLAEEDEEMPQSFQGDENMEIFSAFEFYKRRIASFLQGDGKKGKMDVVAAEQLGKGITGKRRGELKELLESICPEKNAFLMSPQPWKEIQNRVRESIKEGFKDSSEYEGYKEKKKQLFSYQAEYCENEQLVENYQRFRKEIEEDKELSLFEKEYCYVYLDKMVEESIHKNILKNMEAELLELQKERDELRYKIQAIHEKRQQSEYAYVRYLAYECLEKKYKLQRLEANGCPQRKIALRFVDEQKYGEDNVNGIVNVLYGQDGKEKEMNLYIDMQGGSRTFSYVRNAILSILSNQFPEKVQIKEIVSTNFNPGTLNPSEIVIENKRYQIQDLVSGMNAFIRYGKADMIQNYCETMRKLLKTGEDTPVDHLVAHMVEIDNSISLCDMPALAEAIKGMRELLNKEGIYGDEIGRKEKENFVENIFRILTAGIKNDYGRLLEDAGENGDIDYLELISWCARKGFVQQALTLIEDKMPEVYFGKKILNYKFEDGEKWGSADSYVEAVSPKYEKRVENKLFYSMQGKRKKDQNADDPLFEMIWHLRSPKQVANILEKGNERRDFENSRGKKDKIKEYVKDALLRSKYKEGDLKIKKERIETLAGRMADIGQDEEFVKAYCAFRKMNKEYEDIGERKERNLEDPGTVYDIAKDKIDASGQVPFYSILTCCDTWEYTVKTNAKVDSESGSSLKFKITLSLHPKLEGYKEELEQLFLLHEALKQERNCCNHASEKGLRLHIDVVRRAVAIYVKILRGIYVYLGNEMSESI